MATSQPSHRASLLAGLRTGGVRSVSVPHTAGPQASFVVSPPHPHGRPHAFNYPPSFAEEDEMNGLAQMMSNGAHISQHHYTQPHTANCDINATPLVQQQQWSGLQQSHMSQMLNAVHPMTAYGSPQDLQLQMMQMELMRLQTLSQLQQYTQYRHENQQVLPQTVYQPNIGSGYHGQNDQRPVPMTAAIDGKFGRRPSYNGPFEEEANIYGSRQAPVMNQSSGFVNHISSKENSVIQNMVPSKSDSAISWRNNSNEPVLTRDNITHQRRSPLPRRQRPEPLELRDVSNVTSVKDTDSNFSRETSESSNDSSSTKSDGEQVSSTPTTPISGNSNGSLSAAREEASKKLFQGLGLGRPSIHVTAPSESESTLLTNLVGGVVAGTNRAVSQPIRQPRGPPASAEELSTKNFANRIRKKAIGGLEALLEARERREGGFN